MIRLRIFRMTECGQWRLAWGCLVLVAAVISAGCGGGSSGETPPPPPLPDFVLDLSTLSATISQGATSSGIQVSIQPLDGFSGDVQITVGGLPPRVSCNRLAQMNLAASPISVETAPQPQVSALTSAPLMDASADGNTAFLSFAAAPGEPMAGWAAATPGQFLTAPSNIPAPDIAAAADGTSCASRNSSTVEIRDANLSLLSVTAIAELEQIPQRTEVPGIAMHPSGALLYVPFLTGPAPATAPFTGLQGGVEILEAHTGRLRMRIILPEPLAMLAADVDGLHRRFLTVDENGQRIFALTASGLTVVQLARVPLGIGTIVPLDGPAAGGTTLTIRGSGFQSGITATIGGKTAAVTLVDMNTLKIVTPALSAGPQSLVLTNSDGESVSWDAAFTAN